MPVATSVPRRCSSCISIAMSNIFLRSTSVSTTSGSAATRSGLLSDGLAVDDERHGVGARQHVGSRVSAAGAAEPAAAAATCAAAARAERILGRLRRRARPDVRPDRRPARRPAAPPTPARRRLHAQIPARRLDARPVAVREHRPGDLAHFLARGVGDLQLDALGLTLEIPRDDRRLRRVLAEERLIAPELVVAIARRPPEHRGRPAARTASRPPSAVSAAEYSWIGARLSRIQIARPCVARSMALSRGCSVISSIRTVGRLALSRCQLLPRSSDTNSPVSVPR